MLQIKNTQNTWSIVKDYYRSSKFIIYTIFPYIKQKLHSLPGLAHKESSIYTGKS